MIKKIKISSNTYVIGDVHGSLDRLISSMKLAGASESDHFIFLGDLINKGVQNIEVLEYVLRLPNAEIVLGNHDSAAITLLVDKKKRSEQFLMHSGGGWIFDLSEDELSRLTGLLIELNKKAECVLEADYQGFKLGFAHAAIPDEDWEKMGEKLPFGKHELMWGEKHYRDYEQKGESRSIANIDAVFFGHIPVPNIRKIGNALYIDTGSVDNGEISCLRIEQIIDIMGVSGKRIEHDKSESIWGKIIGIFRSAK